jgi:small-conductance mechanosensitive channel
MLVERPVKVGDRITVEDVWGDVTQINLRTTVVTTPDNVSIIIPNSKLLENNVINWTYGERTVRIRVSVGVAYGTDPELVTEILVEAANNNPRVLDEPAPGVWFEEFGDSSLNFLLLCWIPSAEMKEAVNNELNREINRLFKERGVEIPFPQRDLHLRSAGVPISINTS